MRIALGIFLFAFIASCGIYATKPYRISFDDLPKPKRIVFLLPTTPLKGVEKLKFAKESLINEDLPRQWIQHVGKIKKDWEGPDTQIAIHQNAKVDLVLSTELKTFPFIALPIRSFEFNRLEARKIAKKAGATILILPIYINLNFVSADYSMFSLSCPRQNFTDLQLGFVALDTNGDLVASSFDFPAPLLVNRRVSLNRLESDSYQEGGRCIVVGATKVDFSYGLEGVEILKDLAK